MSYKFPKRLVQSETPFKAREFNQDWQPIGDKASGRLNAHDILGDIKEFSPKPGVQAFHKPYYVEVSSNPDWGSPSAGYRAPTLGTLTNASFVPQSSNWSQVESMVFEDIVTGNGSVWIVFWCNYVYHEFIPSDSGAARHTGFIAGVPAPGLQLAIRVDGQVVSESVTAQVDEWHRSAQALKPVSQRDSSNTSASMKNLPGPGLYKSQAIRGIGPQAGAVRVVVSVPVSAGTHTIEAVARSIQPVVPQLLPADAAVVIHNRKLFALECPVFPANAPTRVSVETPTFLDGHVVSQASMKTNRADIITAALNNIEDGDLARGALMNKHLPPTHLDVSHTTILPAGAQQLNCAYPGYGIDTISGTKATGATGWWWLDDGAGVDLTTLDDPVRGAVDILTDGVDSLVIVMGNVQLNEINGTPGGGPGDDIGCMAAFALGVQRDDLTTINILGSTEVYVNNYTYWVQADGNTSTLSRPVEYDVPIFHVFNYSPTTGGTAGADPTYDLDFIGIVGSGFRLSKAGGGPIVTSPDVYYQRGALSFFQIRG